MPTLTRRSIALSPPQDTSRASHHGENLVGEKTPPSSREGEGTESAPTRAQLKESENAHGERESLFDPLGQLYIGREGGARQFSPGPLVDTIFTNRSLGRHTRPINLMGWAIPPIVLIMGWTNGSSSKVSTIG